MDEEYKECLNCKRELSLTKFFTRRNNKDKDYLCKDCRCKKIYDNQPWTALDACEYFDIPFIEIEWFYMVESEMHRCVAEKKQYNTIFPKYLSKMRLKGYQYLTFKDSSISCYCGDEDYYKKKVQDYRKEFLPYDIRNYIDIINYQEKKDESAGDN